MWTLDISTQCRKQQRSGTVIVSWAVLAVRAPAASSKGLSVPRRSETSIPALSKLLHSCYICPCWGLKGVRSQPWRAELMLGSLAQHVILSCNGFSLLCCLGCHLCSHPCAVFLCGTHPQGWQHQRNSHSEGEWQKGKTQGKPVLKNTGQCRDTQAKLWAR